MLKPGSWKVVLENTSSTVEPSSEGPDVRQERYETFGAAKARLLQMLRANRDEWVQALRRARGLRRE